MQEPEQKKKFPWGWATLGCGMVVIGVLAVVLVVLVITQVVPAIKTTVANQAPLPGPLTLPGNRATTVPGPTTGGTTIGDLPFTFSAINDPTIMANQSLMEQMTSSLSLNNDTDFMAPKSYKGSASLVPGMSFTLGNGWCAKDDATLKENLKNIQYTFSINGTDIDLSKYPTINFSDDQGHSCAITGIEITPNDSATGTYQVKLTQKFANQIDDGITGQPYPAGDVTFDFSLRFRNPGAPGSNL